MYCVKKITEDITWIGSSDRKLPFFEGVYPAREGVSYNSYFVDDSKTVVIDTVDKSVSGMFFENLKYMLKGRPLDYVIVTHMEPDHSATLGELVLRYPEVKVVCNQKTVNMIKQFFDFDIEERAVLMNENDKFSSGSHEFTFINAPMVHWPEVMMAYDSTDKILFSADAFGSFGAIDGSIFADSVDYEKDYLDEARRYYTNIVGKYGAQVQMALKKASSLDISMICPLHGLVWRKDLDKILTSYDKWSRYEAEEKGVAVLMGSIYGNSSAAADIIAGKIAEKGLPVKILDMSVRHFSEAVSLAFKYDRIVFVSPTTDGEIFEPMAETVKAIASRNLQNRKIAIVENGTWAPVSGKNIREMLSGLKNTEIVENTISIRSSLKEDAETLADSLVSAICD
ncbi:MAG: FprA family A-type flavoprotein [Clostridiales bacterium]|nr:FprA family A-type flavoprotein [Clostridiales bacterium]